MSTQVLTPIASKLWLIHTHNHSSTPYSHLPLPILREICVYINGPFLLPCAIGAALVLRNLETHRVAVTNLRLSLSQFILCRLTPTRYYCASPHQSAYLLDIELSTLSDLPPMSRPRSYPAVAHYHGCVYIFGGNLSPSLTSCEKFLTQTSEWLPVADMTTGKYACTPCEFHHELYLCCSLTSRQQFEVFTPGTDTFRLLPLSHNGQMNGYISVNCGDMIAILAPGDTIMYWDSRNCTEIASESQFSIRSVSRSSVTPLRVGHTVYWADYSTGGLVSLDFQSSKITTEF